MNSEQNVIYFPEPKVDDPTYCNRNEHVLDWLSRSTVQRAVIFRKILNYHLSKVSQESREHFLNTSRDHWNSAIFEIVVARFLQQLGAKLMVEKEIVGGTKPDFLAHFTEKSVIVEATVPEVNSEVKKTEKQRNPLLNIIESKIPHGWRVGVNKLPEIGLADSKKEFSQIIDEIFSQLYIYEDLDTFEITRNLDKGELVLTLIKYNDSKGIIAIEPVISVWDNTEYRIRNALKNKTSQVRNAKLPVILAVHASGVSSDWEDFDRALYGHSVEVYDREFQNHEIKFQEDGFFLRDHREYPAYAAVLGFVNVAIPYGKDPVLYRNPYFKGELPSAFESLEQRCFDLNSRKIYTLPPKNADIMEKMRMEALNSKEL
jgi:hypothetical protein